MKVHNKKSNKVTILCFLQQCITIIILCLSCTSTSSSSCTSTSRGTSASTGSSIRHSIWFVDATASFYGIGLRPKQRHGSGSGSGSGSIMGGGGVTSSIGASSSWNPLLRRRSRHGHYQQHDHEPKVQLTSSNNNANDNNYDDGEDEWDRLEKIKKDLEPRLGGYRPWSIDTSYRRRPGQYSWTSKLVFINIAIYGLQMINPNVTRMFAKRSDLIMSGRQLYRVITPIFLHGSISHLMLNSFSLNNIGPEVEKLFGGGRFLATYVISGIVGNLASAYYTPNPSLGASGAVFGLMGAYYTFLSRNEHLFGSSGQLMMGRVASTLGMNVLFGMMSPSIDNWAHIGGGIGGVAMATTFGPKLYYMMLPSGGRIVVDKPAVRLPPAIESIPGKIGKRLRRIKRRMQVERYQSELPAKPWRRRRMNKSMWRRRNNDNNNNNNKRRRNNGPPKPRGKMSDFYRKPLYGDDD
mmetsp:Transcript_10373/g.19402  ORF Transcript_10373/g.19402 Transcript_10373/m.19402 type:complete len:465 (-) Transcript_10373:5488-6882(-)